MRPRQDRARGRTGIVQSSKGKGPGPRQPAPEKRRKRAPAGKQPEWAQGLRQLYDSVVDEPLPDAFKDLLDKLDRK